MTGSGHGKTMVPGWDSGMPDFWMLRTMLLVMKSFLAPSLVDWDEAIEMPML